MNTPRQAAPVRCRACLDYRTRDRDTGFIVLVTHALVGMTKVTTHADLDSPESVLAFYLSWGEAVQIGTPCANSKWTRTAGRPLGSDCDFSYIRGTHPPSGHELPAIQLE